jgi:hypothetical protein
MTCVNNPLTPQPLAKMNIVRNQDDADCYHVSNTSRISSPLSPPPPPPKQDHKQDFCLVLSSKDLLSSSKILIPSLYTYDDCAQGGEEEIITTNTKVDSSIRRSRLKMFLTDAKDNISLVRQRRKLTSTRFGSEEQSVIDSWSFIQK